MAHSLCHYCYPFSQWHKNYTSHLLNIFKTDGYVRASNGKLILNFILSLQPTQRHEFSLNTKISPGTNLLTVCMYIVYYTYML